MLYLIFKEIYHFGLHLNYLILHFDFPHIAGIVAALVAYYTPP